MSKEIPTSNKIKIEKYAEAIKVADRFPIENKLVVKFRYGIQRYNLGVKFNIFGSWKLVNISEYQTITPIPKEIQTIINLIVYNEKKKYHSKPKALVVEIRRIGHKKSSNLTPDFHIDGDLGDHISKSKNEREYIFSSPPTTVQITRESAEKVIGHNRINYRDKRVSTQNLDNIEGTSSLLPWTIYEVPEDWVHATPSDEVSEGGQDRLFIRTIVYF